MWALGGGSFGDADEGGADAAAVEFIANLADCNYCAWFRSLHFLEVIETIGFKTLTYIFR